ncbi:Insulin-like growth factor binding protein, N-terminal [Pseudocohnilembus persalinus]|uniref:Insulin-like growth factor binding protein, N-terminal n=1 Tax=Pseudocohnilembus persalinus TaxID=266149 RepID=A0A0V0R5Z9_PSEPJ|nr:Insulin-like growth factor binding protein, N-terminal [Pseudocohnilembus persalinus]|eukprot:KRX09933.1 Insulin-like growth factor binding protein, N-terminal [Pseudocohnilembus persalinus]
MINTQTYQQEKKQESQIFNNENEQSDNFQMDQYFDIYCSNDKNLMVKNNDIDFIIDGESQLEFNDFYFLLRLEININKEIENKQIICEIEQINLKFIQSLSQKQNSYLRIQKNYVNQDIDLNGYENPQFYNLIQLNLVGIYDIQLKDVNFQEYDNINIINVGVLKFDNLQFNNNKQKEINFGLLNTIININIKQEEQKNWSYIKNCKFQNFNQRSFVVSDGELQFVQNLILNSISSFRAFQFSGMDLVFQGNQFRENQFSFTENCIFFANCNVIADIQDNVLIKNKIDEREGRDQNFFFEFFQCKLKGISIKNNKFEENYVQKQFSGFLKFQYFGFLGFYKCDIQNLVLEKNQLNQNKQADIVYREIQQDYLFVYSNIMFYLSYVDQLIFQNNDGNYNKNMEILNVLKSQLVGKLEIKNNNFCNNSGMINANVNIDGNALGNDYILEIIGNIFEFNYIYPDDGLIIGNNIVLEENYGRNINILVEENDFNNNQIYDGNLFIVCRHIDEAQINIIKNKFQNNTAQVGTNFSSLEFYRVNIEDNLFYNNTAAIQSGCIDSTDTKILILKGNNFTLNSAQNGGAISAVTIGQQILIEGNNFEKNWASIKAGAIYIKQMSIINSEKRQIKGNNFTGNFALETGGVIALKSLEVPASLQNFLEGNFFKENFAGNQGGVFYASHGEGNLQAFFGVQAVDNVFLGNWAQSGPIIKLANLKRSGYDYKNYSDFLENQNLLEGNVGEYYGDEYMINCTNGEFYDSKERECYPCGYGLFNYDIENNFYECSQCPLGTQCLGNYTGLLVSQGQWISEDYRAVYDCEKNKKVCLGGNYYENQCFKGYTGVICQVCEEGYVKSDQIFCQICDDDWIIIIKAAFYGLPDSFKSFFTYATTFIQAQTSTIICILPKIFRNNDQLSEIIWNYVFQLVNILVIYFFKKVVKLKMMRKISMETFINQYMIYLMPEFVNQSVNLISCYKVGEKSYVSFDFTIECYSKQYFSQNFVFGVLTLIFWVLMFPTYLFLVIRKAHKPQKKIKLQPQIVRASRAQRNGQQNLKKVQQNFANLWYMVDIGVWKDVIQVLNLGSLLENLDK